MNLGVFLLLVLTIGQVVDTWYRSSLFQQARARVEAEAAFYWRGGKQYFFSAMLNCPFCFLHWAAATVVAGYFVLYGLCALCGAGEPWLLAAIPLVVMAAIRLNWLVNALLPPAVQFDNYRSFPGSTVENPTTPSD